MPATISQTPAPPPHPGPDAGRAAGRAEAGVPGIIVAGGAARRLGGGVKTLRRLGDHPVLDHLIARLAPQCDGLVLNANAVAASFDGFGIPVVADHPEDAGCGPLAGVLAGLDWVAGHRPAARLVLTVPGDTPFLPADLVARLLAGLAAGAALAAARSGGRPHPLAALWPVDLRHALRGMLRTEKLRRVAAAMDRWGVGWVDWPAEPADPFFNVNTPEDLVIAARLAGRRAP